MEKVVDELGRIIIPKEIREKLDIKANDTLLITTENNKIVLTKK